MKGLYRLAITDLQMSQNNLKFLEGVKDDVYLNYIAYHVQQSTEKILKFLIEMQGEIYPRTDNIAVLVDRCEELGVEVPALIQDYDVVITEWATGTRYDSSFVTSKRQLLKVMECLSEWFEQIKL